MNPLEDPRVAPCTARYHAFRETEESPWLAACFAFAEGIADHPIFTPSVITGLKCGLDLAARNPELGRMLLRAMVEVVATDTGVTLEESEQEGLDASAALVALLRLEFAPEAVS